ncbi:MAG: hypothetical protein JRI58_05665 [Deltaproteobacteria bacterium]|nr:hypothetical protein [Deltaproteobacteria bacterium]MBW2074220.1 hypothetical protein [Deltaproteobacteria bacterium]RLB84025.1 MAG: hypothetical protein DRH17_00675 [Deltaproteobacteria bacterium]
MKNGQYKNALVVAAEVLSRTVNWKDRVSCILWGDAAGTPGISFDLSLKPCAWGLVTQTAVH